MKRARTVSPGSDSLPRPGGLSAGARPLGGFGAVLRATLLAVAHTTGVERTTHHVVSHARANPPRGHHRIRPPSAPEGCGPRPGMYAVTSIPFVNPDTSDLPQSRVRLLRGHRPDLKTDTTLLGRATATRRPLIERVIVETATRRACLLPKLLATLADELI